MTNFNNKKIQIIIYQQLKTPLNWPKILMIFGLERNFKKCLKLFKNISIKFRAIFCTKQVFNFWEYKFKEIIQDRFKTKQVQCNNFNKNLIIFLS